MKKYFFILGLLFSQFSLSANIATNKSIESIRAYDGYAVIGFSPPATGAEVESCPSGGESFVVLPLNANTNPQFSVLLAAFSTKSKKVGFGVEGCRAGNGNNYPLIYRVDVIN